MGINEKLERKFLVLYMNAKLFHCICKRMVATRHLYRSLDAVCFQFSVTSNILVEFRHDHHDIRDRIRDYWTTAEQFLTSLYGNTLKRDRYFYIFRSLHFRDKNAEIDRKTDTCDRLWKIRTIFDILNDSYENYYNPSEHLAADEISVKFKGMVVT
jgi:hypothetical protein